MRTIIYIMYQNPVITVLQCNMSLTGISVLSGQARYSFPAYFLTSHKLRDIMVNRISKILKKQKK